MKLFKKAVIMLGFAVFIAAPVVSFAAPQNSYAAIVAPADCEKPILGIHPWFRGLVEVKNGKCNIVSPNQTGSKYDLAGFIWRVALNIIQIAVAVVGYIAFFFVLYGGFLFLTGGSNPSQIEKGRKTIFNAVIGVVIALGAVAVVNLIFRVIG